MAHIHFPSHQDFDAAGSGFDCEAGGSQKFASQGERSEHKQYAIRCSIAVALGVAVGVIGCFAFGDAVASNRSNDHQEGTTMAKFVNTLPISATSWKPRTGEVTASGLGTSPTAHNAQLDFPDLDTTENEMQAQLLELQNDQAENLPRVTANLTQYAKAKLGFGILGMASALVSILYAIKSALKQDNSGGAASQAPMFDIPLMSRTGSTRAGAVSMMAAEAVITVGEVKESFWKSYGKSFLPYEVQGFVGEMLGDLTFSISSQNWNYDRVWALGYESLCAAFLEDMPDKDDTEKIRTSMLTAAGLDPKKVKGDAEAFKSELEGKSEEELLACEDFKTIAAVKDYKYSYMFGAGLISLMNMIDKEMNIESAAVIERWCGSLKMQSNTFRKDAAFFNMGKKRLAEGKEVLMQMQISQKKKLAEKLEKQAQELAAEADKAEAAEKKKETEAKTEPASQD